MKQGSSGIASQILSTHHIALVGPPLIAISIFCFGFVLAHQHAVAQLGSEAHSKPAPLTIQPPSGLLLITRPQLPSLSPPTDDTGTPATDPEDQVTPQLPNVASTEIQKADQRRQDDQPDDNAAPQALLQQLNSTIRNDH